MTERGRGRGRGRQRGGYMMGALLLQHLKGEKGHYYTSSFSCRCTNPIF